MAIDLLKYMIWRNGAGGGGASYEKTVGPAPIISISDAKAKPAKSLVVGMEPIQDLHGYDSPWPAGGGSNQFDEMWESGSFNGNDGTPVVNASWSRSVNYISVKPETSYYCNFEGVGNENGYYLFFYRADNSFISLINQTANSIVTTPADCAKCKIQYKRTIETIGNYKVAVNYPSTVTTYSPYSNLCPITGRTGVTVWDDPAYGGLVTWNQLCSTGGTSGTGGGVTYTNNGDGTWTLTGSGTGTNRKQIGSPSIAANHIIYMRHGADIDGSSSTFCVCISSNGSNLQSTYNRDGGLFRVGSVGMNQFSIRTFSGFTAPDGGLVLCPQLFDLTLMFGEEKAEEIYAMEGGRDYFLDLFPKHYYEYNNSGEQKTVSEVNGDPYRSVNVDWTSEAGTVYGVTIDVVSGVLTVDRYYFKGGWTQYNANNGFKAYRSQTVPYGQYGIDNQNLPMSSVIGKFGSFSSSNMTENIIQPPRSNSNVAYMALDENVSPDDVDLCYLVATPQTYQLTPQQIQLLKGSNTLWSDADELTLTYLAKKE